MTSSIRYPQDGLVSEDLLGQLSIGAPVLMTLNKTAAAFVAPGAAVPYDLDGASRGLWRNVSFADGRFRIPAGIYTVEYVSFSGNPDLEFQVFVNGVPSSPVVAGGHIYMDRFMVTNVANFLEVRNAGSATIALTGTNDDSALSFTRAARA